MGTRFRRLLVWFRRDLRLHDNEALHHAIADAEFVVPIFVLDDAVLRRRDSAACRVRFLCDSLAALHADLRLRGASLVLRRGDPAEEVPRLLLEAGAQGVYYHAEIEPSGRTLDRRVGAACKAIGCEARAFGGVMAVEPEALLTGAGAPYKAYGPYARAWRAHELPVPLPAPVRVPTVALPTLPLPSPEDCGFPAASCAEIGGEHEGRKRLARYIAGGLCHYAARRDLPGVDGTSRLSAHLHLGTLSARDVLHQARASRANVAAMDSVEKFVGELAWRDYFAQLLYHHPRIEHESFDVAYDRHAWENDPAHIDAWRGARTGYPMVDAAMRQLSQEGWMHNRARMIAASFLTKDLLVDWRIGEAHFMQHLVDGDLASNNGGWQWAASTGADASPYFRVFNPVLQGQRFDADGAYVRRYVPELARVPERFVHSPWRMPFVLQRDLGVVIGKDYPAPIVNHAVQRLRAIELYRCAAGHGR